MSGLRNSPTLSSLTYVSSCTLMPGPAQRVGFEGILAASRRHNLRLRITGALLFYDEQFLQVLEGSRESVEQLFAIILKDERHSAVRRIETVPIEQRRFGRWTMAFVNPGLAGNSFVGKSLAHLREDEGALAAPMLDWMRDQLTSADDPLRR